MTTDEVRKSLYKAAKLRCPSWPKDEKPSPSKRIEDLESYMLSCAHTRAELEEGTLYISDALQGLRLKWDTMGGYEPMLGNVEPEKATKPQTERAKRLTDPNLHTQIDKGKHLLERLGAQIRRLEKDEEVASRAYTLMTGG